MRRRLADSSPQVTSAASRAQRPTRPQTNSKEWTRPYRRRCWSGATRTTTKRSTFATQAASASTSCWAVTWCTATPATMRCASASLWQQRTTCLRTRLAQSSSWCVGALPRAHPLTRKLTGRCMCHAPGVPASRRPAGDVTRGCGQARPSLRRAARRVGGGHVWKPHRRAQRLLAVVPAAFCAEASWGGQSRRTRLQ